MGSFKSRMGGPGCCCCSDFLVATGSDGGGHRDGLRKLDLKGTFPSNTVEISDAPAAVRSVAGGIGTYIVDYRLRKIIFLSSIGASGGVVAIWRADMDLKNPVIIGFLSTADMLVPHNINGFSWAFQQFFYFSNLSAVSFDPGPDPLNPYVNTQDIRVCGYNGSNDSILIQENFRGDASTGAGFAANIVWVPGANVIYYVKQYSHVYTTVPTTDGNVWCEIKTASAFGGIGADVLTFHDTSHTTADNLIGWLDFSLRRNCLLFQRSFKPDTNTFTTGIYKCNPDGSGVVALIEFTTSATITHQLLYHHYCKKDDRVYFEVRIPGVGFQRCEYRSMRMDGSDVKILWHTNQAGWLFPPHNYKPSNSGFSRPAFGCGREFTGSSFNEAGRVF